MHVFPDDVALEAICRRYRIRRLSLFGSTLNGAHRPDSDVDLLVEFEPGATPSCCAPVLRPLSSRGEGEGFDRGSA